MWRRGTKTSKQWRGKDVKTDSNKERHTETRGSCNRRRCAVGIRAWTGERRRRVRNWREKKNKTGREEEEGKEVRERHN